jgi:Cof subfamily protein (haloacid dehalogenase superfamily)
MIKLAVFDVDGTLRERDFLPDSTRQALRRLKDKGIELALCTGRSEYEVADLREELEIDWSITCNGSHIAYQGKKIFGTPFPADTVRNWLTQARQLKHTLLLYGSGLMMVTHADDPHFLRAQQEIGFMEPVLLHDSEEIPEIFQCIIFCDESEEHSYTGGESGQYYKHRWRTWAIDINPNGMNKAVGLRMLAKHLGIELRDVAAFGDGLNDMEMIESAGMGIAMGNAVEELKSKSRFVTKSMHDNGIDFAVGKWILS